MTRTLMTGELTFQMSKEFRSQTLSVMAPVPVRSPFLPTVARISETFWSKAPCLLRRGVMSIDLAMRGRFVHEAVRFIDQCQKYPSRAKRVSARQGTSRAVRQQ
jgi:hypothetical protein